MAEVVSLTDKGTVQGRFTVMPAYYLPKEKKRMSLSMIVAIVSVCIVVAVAVVFVLLYTAADDATQPLPQPEQTTQQNQQNQTQPSAQQQQPAQQQPVAQEPVPVVEQPRGIQLPALAVGQFAKDTDTDQDGLTDVEERLFLTSAAVPDTDQDSFIDGMEVKQLYDPATPGALLEVSPQVKTVRNDSFGYQILIPAIWTATRVTPQGEQFQIKPDQGSEAMMIYIYENTDRLTVTEWYQQFAQTPNLTQFVNFSNEGGWNGIQSTDHTYVVAAYGQNEPGARAFMFVMVYDPGQEPVLRYPTIWDMMVNSLSVASSTEITTP